MNKTIHYKLLLISFFFFLKFGTSIAVNKVQFQLDSIKGRIKIENDKKQLVTDYNRIAYLYGDISLDSSLLYSKKGIVLSREINYSHGLAVSHSYIAHAMVGKGELKQAIENYEIALLLFVDEKDSVNILDCYRGLGYVASFGASQLKCLDYNQKALEIASHLCDSASLSVIYNNIGTIYKKLDKYEFALDYFNKAIAIEEKAQVSEDLAISYSNVGVLKVESQRFSEAEVDYQKILELLPKINNEYVLSYLYLSLANYYTSIGDFIAANQYIEKTYAICAENKSYTHIQARLYRRHAELLFKQKKYRESITLFDKCLHLSKSIGVNEEFPEIYELQADAYFSLGNNLEAYHSLKKAKNAIDSLKYDKVSGLLEEFEKQKMENDFRQKELEQALKEQQLENASIQLRSRFFFAVIAIVLLVLIVVIVLYFFFKIKKKNLILHEQHETIHDQKKQLETSVVKLKEREEELQKLNATKDKFFSIIAHDLKSPFNSLLGFNELLLEEIRNSNHGDVETYAQQINVILKQSYTLLNNLLDWSLDKTGGMNFRLENINLNGLFIEFVEYFRKIAPNNRIQIENRISADFEIRADKNMLHSIIRNLISNAIKYTPYDGLITISAKSNDVETRISIFDTGIGISPEVLTKLFKIEETVSTNGLHNEKGTGLGLLLCKDFIEKHNGRIWVESEVGKGSAFVFTIPHLSLK